MTKFPARITTLVLLSGCLLTPLAADEWGSWDDLPDQLLAPASDDTLDIDKLYDQLSADGSTSDDQQALNSWIQSLDLEFVDNEDLVELLKEFEGETSDEFQEALDDWLEEQLESMREDSEDELDDLQDELEDLLDDEDDDLEDQLDDLEDFEEEEEEEDSSS